MMKKFNITICALLFSAFPSISMENAAVTERAIRQEISSLGECELKKFDKFINEIPKAYRPIAIEKVKETGFSIDHDISSLREVSTIIYYCSHLHDVSYYLSVDKDKPRGAEYLRYEIFRAQKMYQHIENCVLETEDKAEQVQLHFATAFTQSTISLLYKKLIDLHKDQVSPQEKRQPKINAANLENAYLTVVETSKELGEPALFIQTLKATALKNLASLSTTKEEKITYLKSLINVVEQMLQTKNFADFMVNAPRFGSNSGYFDYADNAVTQLGYYNAYKGVNEGINIYSDYQKEPTLILKSIEGRIKLLEDSQS